MRECTVHLATCLADRQSSFGAPGDADLIALGSIAGPASLKRDAGYGLTDQELEAAKPLSQSPHLTLAAPPPAGGEEHPQSGVT